MSQVEFAVDLARRAVRCPRWEWTCGMSEVFLNTEGRICGLFVHFGEGRGMQISGWRTGCSVPGGIGEIVEGLPDLSDPATVGGLLDVVRTLYADPGALWGGRIEVHQDHHALFIVVQPYHDEEGALKHRTIATGACEAEALVAALDREGV